MTPPLGVKPMLVSIDRPAFSAVMLAPLPRCAMTRRSAAAQLPHDGLERQAVESVALDALRLQFFGNWQHPGDVGQTGMKLGVETRHLGHAGKVGLRQADERQRLRRVQRREGRSGLQLAQQRSVHQTMLAQGRPAVHDAVPNGVGWRHAGLCEHAGDALEGLRMLGRGDGLTEQFLSPCRIDAVQAELERRRAAVQRQDVQRVHAQSFMHKPSCGPAPVQDLRHVVTRLAGQVAAETARFEATLQRHNRYIGEHGDDMPEILNWRWTA